MEEIENIMRECEQEVGNDLMNIEISDIEVDSTFGLCSGTAGSDGIHAKIIDGANKEPASREYMGLCLSYIWNQAWD